MALTQDAVRLLTAAIVAAGGDSMGKLDRWRCAVVRAPKLGNPTWYLSIRPPRGSIETPKRETTNTTDRDEADRICAARLADLNAGMERGRRVIDVYDEHMAFVEAEFEKGRLSSRTATGYSEARKHFSILLGDAREADLSPSLVVELLDRLDSERNLRRGSAKAAVGKVATAWRWAHGLGLVDRPWTPAPAARSRRNAQLAKSLKRPLTPGELARIADKLPVHYRPIFRFMAETALRSSEACGLTVGDVRPDCVGLWWAHFKDAKDHRPRRVPVVDPTWLDLGRGAADPLWLNKWGIGVNHCTFYKAVARTLDRLKIRKRVGPASRHAVYDVDLHSLRRSWITFAELAEVPEMQRRAITGHKAKGVHQRYTENYVGSNLHQVVLDVIRWREGCSASLPGGTSGLYTGAVEASARPGAIAEWTRRGLHPRASGYSPASAEDGQPGGLCRGMCVATLIARAIRLREGHT